jgi:hypothetical protein
LVQQRRRSLFALIGLALSPALVVALSAEAVVRVRFFFGNGHDWFYITSPFGHPHSETYLPTYVRPATDQIVFNWQRPCVDRMVYSPEQGREMPRTWDEHCLRGDRVATQKAAD